ncbi:MAG: macro domain-containing protein [Lachnospiraceae bacterium]|nr:macro domain-containing protein [Lachnospiraceae bacterium]
MALKIVRNDICKMKTEAIVNTANQYLTIGAGCDSAIYKAAGEEKLLNYRREHIGEAEEGDVFVTPGFNLLAKYIFHAVSPAYHDGNHGEEEKLRACYRKCLELADKYMLKSIAFPLISTGSFGYPMEDGIRIAADEINAFMLSHNMDVYLVVFDTKSTLLGEKLYPKLEAYIDRNYVVKAQAEEYGAAYFNLLPGDATEDRAYSRGSAKTERRLRDNLPKFAAKMASMAPSAYMAPSPAEASVKEAGIDAERAEIKDKSTFCFEDNNEFDEKQESRLKERMKHLSDSFSEYLLYLIKSKGMDNVDVWHRGIVDKKVFSKIKNNADYHPKKLTAMCLCIGAKLNLDETKDLLARAGYALSPSDKTDIIFSFFIENEIYDMIELDIQLEEYGLPCII